MTPIPVITTLEFLLDFDLSMRKENLLSMRLDGKNQIKKTYMQFLRFHTEISIFEKVRFFVSETKSTSGPNFFKTISAVSLPFGEFDPMFEKNWILPKGKLLIGFRRRIGKF
ncbi:hypothetical protein AB3N59_14035 [Leptospira sp. WS92.C1]